MKFIYGLIAILLPVLSVVAILFVLFIAISKKKNEEINDTASDAISQKPKKKSFNWKKTIGWLILIIALGIGWYYKEPIRKAIFEPEQLPKFVPQIPKKYGEIIFEEPSKKWKIVVEISEHSASRWYAESQNSYGIMSFDLSSSDGKNYIGKWKWGGQLDWGVASFTFKDNEKEATGWTNECEGRMAETTLKIY